MTAKNTELVNEHFITEKVEVHGNEFLLFRTKQSKDVWQFRVWNGTEQKYIRKSTRQKDLERAKRVATKQWKEIIATQSADTVNAKRKRIRKSKGNKILEEHVMFEGDVRIFRVAQSGKVWQIYIWVREERKAIKKSLRTRDTDLARERAREIYLDYIAKARNNQPIFDRKAKELTDAFIEHQLKRHKQGSITLPFVKTLETRMKHYLRFVGESIALTKIKEDAFENYRLFRKEAAPKVTLMTLYNERGTIKALYKFAKEKGFIHNGYEPYFGEWEKIGKSGEKINRDALSPKEWTTIYRYMQSWHTKKNVKDEKQAIQRRFIYQFTLVLCSSGIRFGEARRLQWRDIELYEQEVIENDKKVIKKRAKINLPASKTKTGKARTAISRLGNPFHILKKISKHTNSDDYIFVDNEKGTQLMKKVYYKEWKAMLKDTGLDEGNKNIVYYCLRHTYATFELYKGTDVFKLSKVMGCGIDFIQNHYGQVEVDVIKDQFTRELRDTEGGRMLLESGNIF